MTRSVELVSVVFNALDSSLCQDVMGLGCQALTIVYSSPKRLSSGMFLRRVQYPRWVCVKGTASTTSSVKVCWCAFGARELRTTFPAAQGLARKVGVTALNLNYPSLLTAACG
jgi:hypothetical protein